MVLVPAGDQTPSGQSLAAERGRLRLSGEEWPLEDQCWVAAGDAELVDTDACGLYLRVVRPTLLQGWASQAEVEPGLYQVIRTQA